MQRSQGSLALFVFALLMPHAVLAAEPRVYISEVAWAGSSISTADEWLELTNAGDASADISGWRIEGAATGGTALVVPTGSMIAPGATFLIANYGADDPKSSLAAPPQWVTTAVALPNDKLSLVLRDTSGTIVDAAGVSGSPPPAGATGAVKASMERAHPDIVGSDTTAWRNAVASIGFDAGSSDSGTPGAAPVTTGSDAVPAPSEESSATTTTATSAPTPSVVNSPTAVRLSELMPLPPKGQNEWVELVNRSGIGEFIDGWTLEDGHSEIARLSGLIQPWGRIVATNLTGHLNDGGDLVILKDGRGFVVDTVAYGSWQKGAYASAPGLPKRGESVARVEQSDDWSVTASPTPGTANVIDLALPAAPEEAPVIAKATSETHSETITSSTTTAATLAATAPSPKKPPSAKVSGGKPKTVAKSRYKGTSRQATVAVPLGVYGKTRMIVQVDGALRELRLSKAPSAPPDAGEHIAFVAQEKSDAGHAYLAANVNSMASLDDAADEPVFAPMQAWPTAGGPVELKATVVSANQYEVTAHAGDRDGLIDLPTAAKIALKPGDQISVRGFVAPDGEKPTLFLAAADALDILARAADAAAPANGFRLPPWATASLTMTALGVGVLAYLRNERLKRLSLVRREDDLPLEE